MATTTELPETSFAYLHERLGGIPLVRIRREPPPGTATEEDLERAPKPVCELIDGVLVEKAMGNRESLLAMYIGGLLRNHIEQSKLGVILGADGFFRLEGGQVRAPDASFTPWSAFPEGEPPDDEAYWSVAPALAVEVLSPRNTTAEIDRKLGEFFAAGCQLAWVIDPDAKSARVYTSAKKFKEYGKADTLDGGKVLPGFKLSLADLFASAKPPRKKPR
jgi:Uma2 family endonuclease